MNVMLYAIGILVGSIKQIGTSGIGYGEHLVIRVMTYKSNISLLTELLNV